MFYIFLEWIGLEIFLKNCSNLGCEEEDYRFIK